MPSQRTRAESGANRSRPHGPSLAHPAVELPSQGVTTFPFVTSPQLSSGGLDETRPLHLSERLPDSMSAQRPLQTFTLSAGDKLIVGFSTSPPFMAAGVPVVPDYLDLEYGIISQRPSSFTARLYDVRPCSGLHIVQPSSAAMQDVQELGVGLRWLYLRGLPSDGHRLLYRPRRQHPGSL